MLFRSKHTVRKPERHLPHRSERGSILLKSLLNIYKPSEKTLVLLKYIGPGFLVTVGFIDPGNWASNVAAGATYGYQLLWMVSLSTVMLIALQHNAAHLGIATGLCLSEASRKHLRPWASLGLLATAMMASVSTALAEVLGAAIGLQMLFGIPLFIGSLMTAGFVATMLFTNSYKRLETWVLAFVSLIGFSFLIELAMVQVEWPAALKGWVLPSFPEGSIPIAMSVLGAVVMPHNIFLHSEVIQSRKWNLESDAVIEWQLKYEFYDTLLAMIVGWAINSAMILVAASTFFVHGIPVSELSEAQATLKPLLGNAAAVVFAFALLVSGLASSVTAAMAGGSIFGGAFLKPYDIQDRHSRMGIVITIAGALAAIALLGDPFRGLIWSQIVLSIQLPWTIFALISLTSSTRVMGKFANPPSHKASLWTIAVMVTALNIMLLFYLLRD